VALLWVSAGALLVLVQSGSVTRRNLFTVSGFFIVCWSYLNILSERWRYGDYSYYFESAATMYRNEPLHGSYFYPPLWATLTQFLVPAGEQTFFNVLWLLDFVSFAAFYFLLQRILERYGFGARFAAVVTTAFMLANAPLLRTLVYVQVNLHTLNLIFLALLLYPKRTLLSALMLALAVHLKGSPAVLVLAFLLEKDWRWLAWFSLCLITIAGLTVVTDGFMPFLNVLQHWQGLALSNNTIYRPVPAHRRALEAHSDLPREVPARSGLPVDDGPQRAPRPIREIPRFRHAAAERHPTSIHSADIERAGGVGAPRCLRGAFFPADAQAPGDAARVAVVWLCLPAGVPAPNLRFLSMVVRAPGRADAHLVADVAPGRAQGRCPCIQAAEWLVREAAGAEVWRPRVIATPPSSTRSAPPRTHPPSTPS